jgi:hypothetical protein
MTFFSCLQKNGALEGTRTPSVTDLNRVCLPISPPGRYSTQVIRALPKFLLRPK